MKAIFFPRKDYDVEVCAHRLGKKMTYTEQTDRIMPSTSFPWIYGLSQTYGIKVGFFSFYGDFSDSNYSVAKAALDAGNVWFDQYSMAPSIEEKIKNYDDVTDEEFEAAYENELLPVFMDGTGRKPVALSYAYGVQSFSNAVCPLYLGARNSGGSSTNGGTDYGVGYGSPSNLPYSFANYKSRSSTIRWYDRHKSDSSFSAGISEVASLIDTTMLNGGWLNNFTHFHSVMRDGNESSYDQYFQMLAQKNSNDEIYFSGYGEAVAYLVYRQLITRAGMYSPVLHNNEQLVIQLETNNSTLQADTDLLQVPISIKFSTVGTPLANQAITSDCNLISLGSGDYIVEIPFSRFPKAVISKQLNP